MTPIALIADLAAAMRAVGAGRATVDGLSLDLTVAPLAVVDANREVVAPKPKTREEAQAEYERTLFAASGGRRRRLPL